MADDAKIHMYITTSTFAPILMNVFSKYLLCLNEKRKKLYKSQTPSEEQFKRKLHFK